MVQGVKLRVDGGGWRIKLLGVRARKHRTVMTPPPPINPRSLLTSPVENAQVDIKRAAMEEPTREVSARIYVYSQGKSREYT